ncbi:MAG: DUF99 family protein [Methanocellales archaeon]|nr:DUF99 family protein [Methanocellales archaeon]MDD3292083.1 DUF99 family protein [Methanocellales archaeon]MDD5235536.1 DUF99 family protein [Methanocellales archaeon]
MHVKPEIRILAIDDGPLVSDKIMVIGTIFRGADWLDCVLRTEMTRDGYDATEKIIALAKNTKHYDQIRVIMLNGITYAGFNVVDIPTLQEQTNLPVIVVMDSLPDFEQIHSALQNLEHPEERWNFIQRAGEVFEVAGKDKVYIQICGIDLSSSRDLIQLTSIHSRIPEPLRVAHLIATGVGATGVGW